MNILEVHNLTIRVEDKEILRDVSLDLKKGESHILFEPNGSGKTTLICAIMGIPSYNIISGKTIFDGKDITATNVDEA